MGSFIAQKVGRGQIAKNIRPLFEYLQSEAATRRRQPGP
jgi:hypothetical protein